MYHDYGDFDRKFLELFLSFSEDKELAERLIRYSYPSLTPLSLYENCSVLRFLELAGKEAEEITSRYSVRELREKLLQLEEAVVKATVWRTCS